MSSKKAAGPRPTEMGQRILDFMRANGITNRASFAENVLGISRQSFHAWLYTPINPEKVAARPLLMCAEALSTNPEYLLCISDDPTTRLALTLEEAHLVQAYRSLSPTDRLRLMKNAADWIAESPMMPSTAAPFRAPLPGRKLEPER